MELSKYIKLVLDEIGSLTGDLMIDFEVSLNPEGEVVSGGSNIVKFTLSLEEPEEQK